MNSKNNPESMHIGIFSSWFGSSVPLKNACPICLLGAYCTQVKMFISYEWNEHDADAYASVVPLAFEVFRFGCHLNASIYQELTCPCHL